MAFQPPKLRPDQQAAANFMIDNPHCGIFLGIGGGKSLSTLTALSQIRPSGHILVIAPLAIARSVWVDEIEKWGFPLRTRSLIVDENDRQLTREQRVEAFQQVLTDPPTMYFINQELLTQPSNQLNVLVPAKGAPVPQLSEHAQGLLDIITSGTNITAAQAGDLYREQHVTSGAKPPAKTRVAAALKELTSSGVVLRERIDCPGCSGRGCTSCKFGLVDQMPTYRVGGKKVVHWPFPTVIIDESQGFKDGSSNRFKALKRMRPSILRLIELTGTPAPQSLLDLWSQMYLLDQGATLGTYTQYRARFFTPTAHIDGRPIKWAMNAGADQEIHRLVAPYVMSTQNTSIPRPPVTFNPTNVTLPAAVLKAYKDFARDQVLELAMPDPNDPRRLVITADNAAILHNKLVQFSSGTIYTDDKHNYQVLHREKLEVLGHLVANASGNVLVAYRYISEKKELVPYLTKQGHHVEEFDGSRDMVRRWNAGLIKVLVVHPASAGPGLNLQDGGSTLIWHTLPDALVHYDQLNGRLVRPGQTGHVQIYEMTTKGTLDATLPRRLQRKAQVQQGLLDAVQHDDVVDLLSDLDLGDLDINPL